MNIIIPMAGRGSRLRPHTLTTPKPLIPIAGKPIVERLVTDLVKVCATEIDEIAFIIDRSFGKDVEDQLTQIASNLSSTSKIYYQDEKLGTAHAVLMAADSLVGNVLVAFADTLFKADFNLDKQKDAIVWVQKVENPSAYGVVQIDNNNIISEFVEKPEEYVSDLAIIGIYYFKSGETLKDELQYLVDNDIRIKGGEFGLTDALENMKEKGTKLYPGEVIEWLDCGNKKVTVETNARYLTYLNEDELIDPSVELNNSTIIPPVFIGSNCVIENSVLGPHVSIGRGCTVKSSLISNSLIQNDTRITSTSMHNSMIGAHAKVEGKMLDLNIGDYCTLEG